MTRIAMTKTVLLSMLLLVQSSMPVWAVTETAVVSKVDVTAAPEMHTMSTHEMNHPMPPSSASANVAVNGNDLSQIIAHADEMITNRVSSLQHVLDRINKDKRLSSDEKTSLTADAQTQITGLQTLKTKIDADTDAPTAKTDAKQIITNYYIYAVFQPKMQLLITLNSLQTMVTNLQALIPQIQTLLTTYGQGQDTTQIQSYLTDMSSQLSTASTAIGKDLTTVEALSISNPDAARTSILQVKTDISSNVKPALQKVRQDFSNLRPLLKALIGTNTTDEQSGTPAAMPVKGLRPINATPEANTSTASPEVNTK